MINPDLEHQITEAYLRLCDPAGTPETRRQAYNDLTELCSQRTAERVREMEKERGLISG